MVLGTAAIVVTHHITAYMLAIVLAAIAVTLHYVIRREVRWPNPWPFAVLAAALAAVWLIFVATATAGYLTPVLQDAWTSLIHTISGQSGGRGLFQASSADSQDVAATAPFVARVVTFSSVLLLLAALPFGLRQVWLRYRTQPFAPILCLAAVGFFATLGLVSCRRHGAANRAAEFLFLGLAFVVALAIPVAYSWLEGRGPRSAPWFGRAVLAGGLGVVPLGASSRAGPGTRRCPRRSRPTPMGGRSSPSRSGPPASSLARSEGALRRQRGRRPAPDRPGRRLGRVRQQPGHRVHAGHGRARARSCRCCTTATFATW